jgi:hypothetical protein
MVAPLVRAIIGGAAAVTRSAGSAIGPSGEIERRPVQIPGSLDPDEHREALLVLIAI